MIKVYLDWNVISNIKRDEFKNIKEFIDKNKEAFLFPYTPAHFKDLMKSYSPDNNSFFEDLKTLDYLCGSHLLSWDKTLKPQIATPSEYFDSIKDQEDFLTTFDFEDLFKTIGVDNPELSKLSESLTSLLKSIPIGHSFGLDSGIPNPFLRIYPTLDADSTMWDFMKAFIPFSNKLLKDKNTYKNFRNEIRDSGLKLDSNHGNWNVDEVIGKLDELLGSFKEGVSFEDYVKTTLSGQKEPVNNYQVFTTAYLLLDMLGYKPDRLPKKTDSMQNITIDAEHAFFGAHCDFFVVDDKVLNTKAKVLYSKFNIISVH